MLNRKSRFNVEKTNANGLKLIGKSKEDVIGKKCYKVLHDVNTLSKRCPLKKSFKSGKVESV